MSFTDCPVCGNKILKEENTVKNEILECSDCATELEVISLEPFDIQEAPSAEEDWGE